MSGPEPSKLERQARDALDRLPATADGIAGYFAEVGIKGLKDTHDQCPVANYLVAETEGANHASVWSVAVVGAERHDLFLSQVERTQVQIPEHVQEFVGNFDHGNYPGLVADGQVQP